jgi:hypothetical protein
MKVAETIIDGRSVVMVEPGERVVLKQVIERCIQERALENKPDGYHYGVKLPGRNPGFYTRTELAMLMASTCWW